MKFQLTNLHKKNVMAKYCKEIVLYKSQRANKSIWSDANY